jgi:hypothetical protein
MQGAAGPTAAKVLAEAEAVLDLLAPSNNSTLAPTKQPPSSPHDSSEATWQAWERACGGRPLRALLRLLALCAEAHSAHAERNTRPSGEPPPHGRSIDDGYEWYAASKAVLRAVVELCRRRPGAVRRELAAADAGGEADGPAGKPLVAGQSEPRHLPFALVTGLQALGKLL